MVIKIYFMHIQYVIVRYTVHMTSMFPWKGGNHSNRERVSFSLCSRSSHGSGWQSLCLSNISNPSWCVSRFSWGALCIAPEISWVSQLFLPSACLCCFRKKKNYSVCLLACPKLKLELRFQRFIDWGCRSRMLKQWAWERQVLNGEACTMSGLGVAGIRKT